MSVLSAQNLIKQYRARQVVSGISLSLESGEVVGLLGANGAGKTTCFYMITGLVQADSGMIHIDKHDITNLPMSQRAHLGLGYLPQESSIFRKLTVAENIMAVLETQHDFNRRTATAELEDLLTEFRIAHIRNNMGITLSGGERRRVEIARALAQHPLFLLLDEPFAGIDPISISDIKAMIKYLNKQKGLGILITDHNVRETLDICDRGYIVNNGKIIKSGMPEEILADEQVRKTYLGESFKL